MSKLRTSAQISEESLMWLFGIELGIIDASIHSIDELEQYVDTHYTKQQITDLTLNPAL
jgi:hypothetical protein